ncbi:hypothetical protein PtA15_2A818 [Puccinia triticina]|uniref:Secreted protein n=1 Tax=Puccinia triticina TaxID=208348 RepID=A0ABY7CBC0_9BASI|nr:uncharacterized protein PtA15_2A818 [Puccinia triticina]WAQ82501.1 hypothetical protein PtA15_2A818 [Puccinia triticina]
MKMLIYCPVVLMLLASVLGEPCPDNAPAACFSPKDYNNKDLSDIPVQFAGDDHTCQNNLPMKPKGDKLDTKRWRTRCCLKTELQKIDPKFVFNSEAEFKLPRKTLTSDQPLEDPPYQKSDPAPLCY